MCRCEICGSIFDDRPKRRVSIPQPDGYIERGYDMSCPYCGAGENFIKETEE